MKSKWLLVTLLIVALFAAFPAFAHDDECSATVSLYNGWARATAPGATVGAAYGFLVNLTETDDTLVSASTDAADVVELHEVIMEGDVMQMRPVEGGFPVMAHHFTTLQPGGYHIMLLNLTRQLEVGGTLEITLTFANEGDVALTLPIVDPDGMMGMGGMGGMGGGMMESTAEPMHNMGDMQATAEPMMMMGESPCGVHALDVWARPNTGGAPNSGAYMLLVNPDQVDDALVGVASDVASAVEVHEMTMGAGDVMQMRPVEGQRLVVPAGGAVQLKPGGYHVMLIGLTRDLAVGDTFALTLTFESGDEKTLDVIVREPEAMGGGMHMGG